MRYRVVGGRIDLGPEDATRPRTLAEAFVRSIERFAQRDAIQPVEGPSITYADLGDRVRVAVAALRRLGLHEGARLAICLPNGIDWAAFAYAAALLGACVVPINLRFRADELAYVLRGSQAAILVTQRSFMTNDFVARLRELAGGPLGAGDAAAIEALPDLRRIVLVDGTREPGTVDFTALRESVEPCTDLPALATARRPDEPLWLFWTSGTTSAPKGALLPQSCIESTWRWTRLGGYREDDRVLTARPFFYIAGLFWTLLGPMLHGATTIVSDRLDAEQMQALCRRHAVTVLNGNPLMMKDLVDREGFERDAFAHLRMGHFGGSAMPPDELKRIASLLGYRELMQTYGMTEFAGHVTSTLPDDPIEIAADSCGYPFTDVELRLVDPVTGEDVPDGEIGMVVSRGQKLIDYLNLPDDARAALFDADGWYRSGDLMRRLPDGRYRFVGRSKDLIKVNGENVTAAEIEATLMKHPAISLASVVGRTHRERGEVPVAFVETRVPDALDLGALRAWCRERMAPFKVPAEFVALRADQWPKTVSGKIAKHLLTPAFAERLGEGASGGATAEGRDA